MDFLWVLENYQLLFWLAHLGWQAECLFNPQPGDLTVLVEDMTWREYQALGDMLHAKNDVLVDLTVCGGRLFCHTSISGIKVDIENFFNNEAAN
ncbi:hypothetical protein SLEP1_g50904 [Rubroshorea leprosula]|uniref:Uncharacterized protein n=1 Tax=Rubroshorea leprosula TaxID=152421 RepID=A0AAV5M1I3_9ROSI|nr:hypothetical protein SLEP1_g50904 [Rubroshorea leprosula]